MQFVYRPEGAEPKKWPFDLGKLMSPEAEAIERHTGWTFGEWQDKLDKGSMLAYHGLLFVYLKRETPTLRWEQVVFALDEVDLELTEQEQARIVAALERKRDEEGLTADEEATLEETRAGLISLGSSVTGDVEPAPKASAPASSDGETAPVSSPT